MRTGLVAVAAMAAIGLLCLHRARAVASELVLQTGAAMLPYARATFDDVPRTLHVNGAPLFVRSGWTRDAPASVIEVYAARCRARPLVAGLPAMLRLGSEDEAFLACFEPERALDSLAELAERFAQVLEHGDLAPLGELRLTWAARTAQGARYTLVWSERGLPWEAMFPETGDAPGAELKGVPRPQGARRVLAIGHDARAAALASYASGRPLEATAARYRAELQGSGFAVARMPGDDEASAVLHVRRGAHEALAFLSSDGVAATLVTLVALDALDALDANDATAMSHAR